MKRGQTKIIIVSLVILLILIGIGVGFFILKSKAKTQPDPLSVQCENACNTNQEYGFCGLQRKLTDELSATCKEISENSEYAKYNVQPCPNLCDKPVDKTCVEGLGGTWEFPVNEGCPIGEGKIGKKLTSTDSPPTQGQICCV